MKYLLLIILLFPAKVFAQDSTKVHIKKYYGRVVGEDNNGLPHAIVEVKELLYGEYCDINGRFKIEVNIDSAKVLQFYSYGYERKEVVLAKLHGDSIYVMLKKIHQNLGEVVVKSARKRKVKHDILGRRKLKCIGSCYQAYGEEIAIFLESDPERNGILNEAFFYLTNEGTPTSKFRIHVYGIDTTSQLDKKFNIPFPGKEITDTDIVANGVVGNDWVKVDLSSKNIRLGKGVFLSMEWVLDFGNSEEPVYQKDFQKYYVAGSEEIMQRHLINGQVLGLTWGYGIQGLMFHKNHDEWYPVSLITPNRHLLYTSMHGINPMIYATYSYSK